MRLIYALILITVFTIFCARMTRPLLLTLASRYSTSSHNRKRVVEFQKFEKQIFSSSTAPSFIFGASSVEGFMDSRILDQKFKQHQVDVAFYNMGFPMLSYYELSLLAEGIQEKLSQTNKKAELSLIRLEPALLTKTFFYGLKTRESKFDFERLIHLSTASLGQKFVSSIENWIYGTGGQDDFTFWLSDLFFSRQNNNSKIHYAPWIFWQFQEEPEWNYEKRGNTDFNKTQSYELFESIMKQKSSPELEGFAWSEITKRFGANQFDFEETLVKGAIEDIKSISKFSKKTIVFFYPDRGSEQNLTEQAKKNLQTLFERIQTPNNATLVIVEAQKLEHRDYYDPTHLSPSGWNKVSDILVEAALK